MDGAPEDRPASPPVRVTHRPAPLFITTSVGWFVVLALLRAYEFLLVRSTHLLPGAAISAELRGVLGDLQLTFVAALLLAGPVLLLARWYPVAANRLHRGVLAGIAMGAVGLAQYFATTFVPLGADLFGYSWSDVTATVRTSGDVGVGAVLALILAAAASWISGPLARRLPVPRSAPPVLLVVALAAAAVPTALTPTRGDFDSDAAWFLAQNKTWYFGARSAARLGIGAPGDDGPPLSGFPLLRRASYDDVLGPLLRTASSPPNIVLVVVEGLGRDFVGEGAALGGFTPFLDSLATRSLYWENFLSVSGRTFGSMPALLGSLPYGDAGFMGLRTAMPPHLTLVRLLRERGYATSYFTGTDGHFDYIDAFLDRQGIERFVDQSAFGPEYEKQPAGVGGFSWGYPDDALFRRSLELIGTADRRPRLDVYLTVTTHEPFIPPRAEAFGAEFERRFALLPPDPARRATVRAYSGVFTTLLYTDDAIRRFIEAYARRADYGRTIFIITGDHRLIPIPPAERIDRYRVPFIVHSPLVVTPRRFSSVSTHLDVTPSLVSLLHGRYRMTFPDSVAWLGTGIDTSVAFRNIHSVPLMRAKNDLDEYLDGPHLLSSGDLFGITDRLGLFKVDTPALRDSLSRRLARFRAVNRYVTRNAALYPPTAADSLALREEADVDSIFRALKLRNKTPTEAFVVAHELAVRRDFVPARLIARRLLRDSPAFHDARALLGRTYGWDNRFVEAREILTELVRRAPDYEDGHVALIDVERWAGQPARSLSLAQAALTRFPGSVAVRERIDLARRAQAAAPGRP